MALHTRSEFQKLTGLSRGNLYNYIVRGSVVETEGFINDELPENENFLKKRQEFLLLYPHKANKEALNFVEGKKKGRPTNEDRGLPPKKKPVTKAKKEPKPKKEKVIAKKEVIETLKPIISNLPFIVPEPEKQTVKPQNTPPKKEEIAKTTPLYELEKRIKTADLEKKLVDTRIAKLKEAKMKGENIPVDLVKNVFTQLGNAMITSYRTGAELFLQNVCHQNKISDSEMAKLRGKLTKIINESHTNAIDIARKSIEGIQKTFSETKGVGEHE